MPKCIYLKNLFLSFILLINLKMCDSARILCLFPLPSPSHQYVFRTLTEELLQLGHELVVVTTEPGYPAGEAPPNLTEIYSEKATQSAKSRFASEVEARLQNRYNIVSDFGQIMHDAVMYQFQSKEFQKIITDGTEFDLLILQSVMTSNLIISHFFKAPVIIISSMGFFFDEYQTGVPRHEFIYPNMMRRTTINASFFELVCDINFIKKVERVLDVEDIQNKDFKRIIGDGAPTIRELINNIDIMVVNHFNIWAGIRPIPLNVVHAGGILSTTRGRRDLPEDVQNFLDSSVNGVIYMSFGTLAPTSYLSREKLQIIANALSNLPYDVLWKLDRVELSGKGKNIKTFKWLPQKEVLKHPKLKLLITHGGLHSTDEAIIAGVPLIGIPFSSDQFFNSDNYVRYNIGLRLDFPTLTEEAIEAAITKVITDKSYRTNVIHLRALLRDRPLNAQTQAASWVQYVLRHGGARHLRAPSAGLPWARYLELELVAIVLAALALLTAIFMVLLYHIYKLLIKLSKKVWSRIIVWIRTR